MANRSLLSLALVALALAATSGTATAAAPRLSTVTALKITKKVRLRDLAGDFADLVDEYGENPYSVGMPACKRKTRISVVCWYLTLGEENADHNAGSRTQECRVDIRVHSHTSRQPTWKRQSPACWHP